MFSKNPGSKYGDVYHGIQDGTEEVIGSRCAFQTTNLAGIDFILDIIDQP